MTDQTSDDSIPAGFTPVDDSSTQNAIPAGFTPIDDTPQKDTSYLGALEYGVHNVTAGLSKSDEAAADYFAAHGHPAIAAFFRNDQKNTTNQAAATNDPNYAPAGANLKWNDPSTYGNLPRAVVESSPAVAPALVGTAVAGPIGGAAMGALTGAATQGGNNLAARMANQPQGQAPTNADYAAAFGTPLATGAALGALPGGSTIDQGILGTAATLGKGVARDAAIGAGGDAVQQVANTAGTQNGLTAINPNEIANSGLIGGAMGASLGAGRAVSDRTISPILADRAANTQANKLYGDLDPQTTANLNSRLDDAASVTNADQSTPAGKGVVIKNTQSSLDTDLGAIQGDGLQTSRNGQIFQVKDYLDQLQPFDQRFVNDTIGAVQDGHVVAGSRLDELNSVLSNDPTGAGQALGDIVNQYSAFNSIIKNGSWNEKAGTFVQPTPSSSSSSSGGIGSAIKSAVAGAGLGTAGEMIADTVMHGMTGALPHGMGAALGIGAPIAYRMIKGVMSGASPSTPAAPDSLGLFQRYAANAQSPIGASPAPGAIPGAPPPSNPTPPSANVINFAQARAALQAASNGGGTPPAPASPAPASPGIDPAVLAMARARAQQAVAQAVQQGAHNAPGEAPPIAPQMAQGSPQTAAQAAQAPTPAQQPAPAPEAGPAAAQADPLAAPPILPGSIRARALQAVAENRAKQTQADADQSANINAQAQAARPPDDAPSSSSTSSADTASTSSASSAQGASASSTQGDTHTYQGMDFPIPSGLRAPRSAYVKSLESKQDLIMGTLDAAKQQASDPQTSDAIDQYTQAMRGARNQDTAKGFVNSIVRNAAPVDRPMLDNVFNADFYNTWSKKKPTK